MPLFKVVIKTTYYVFADNPDAREVRRPASPLDDIAGDSDIKVRKVRSKDPFPEDDQFGAYVYSPSEEGPPTEGMVDLKEVWPVEDGEPEEEEDEEEPNEEREPEPPKPPPATSAGSTPFSSYPPSSFVVLSNGLVSLGMASDSGPVVLSATPHRPVDEPVADDFHVPAGFPSDRDFATICMGMRIHPAVTLRTKVQRMFAQYPNKDIEDIIKMAAKDKP